MSLYIHRSIGRKAPAVQNVSDPKPAASLPVWAAAFPLAEEAVVPHNRQPTQRRRRTNSRCLACCSPSALLTLNHSRALPTDRVRSAMARGGGRRRAGGGRDADGGGGGEVQRGADAAAERGMCVCVALAGHGSNEHATAHPAHPKQYAHAQSSDWRPWSPS